MSPIQFELDKLVQRAQRGDRTAYQSLLLRYIHLSKLYFILHGTH